MLKVTQEKRTFWSSRRLTRSSKIDNRQGHELKGEEAQLKCSAEYADAVTSDVTLEEMHGNEGRLLCEGQDRHEECHQRKRG